MAEVRNVVAKSNSTRFWFFFAILLRGEWHSLNNLTSDTINDLSASTLCRIEQRKRYALAPFALTQQNRIKKPSLNDILIFLIWSLS